jgi:hypothetical protein
MPIRPLFLNQDECSLNQVEGSLTHVDHPLNPDEYSRTHVECSLSHLETSLTLLRWHALGKSMRASEEAGESKGVGATVGRSKTVPMTEDMLNCNAYVLRAMRKTFSNFLASFVPLFSEMSSCFPPTCQIDQTRTP